MTPNGFGPTRMQDFNYNNPRSPLYETDCPCAEKLNKACPPCTDANSDHYTNYNM